MWKELERLVLGNRAVVMKLSPIEVFPNQQEFALLGDLATSGNLLWSRYWAFPDGASGKEHACQCRRHETRVRSLGQKDPLEESMATHSSILAWRIPWTEEPGGLQSRGLQKVRHDCSDSMHTRTTCAGACAGGHRPPVGRGWTECQAPYDEQDSPPLVIELSRPTCQQCCYQETGKRNLKNHLV